MSYPVEEWITKFPINGLPRPDFLLPREKAASYTAEDWPIFAIHGNYVRPTREWEFYHGEPCRRQSRASGKGIEIPPGAVYYYKSSMGHPATSWDPFVFPNPPRTFLMCQPSPHYIPPDLALRDKPKLSDTSLLGTGLTGPTDELFGNVRGGRLRRFRRRVNPAEFRKAGIPPIELDDLERQLWFDPEPRFERPFRTYADTKYCTKGANLIDVAQLMRPGW